MCLQVDFARYFYLDVFSHDYLLHPSFCSTRFSFILHSRCIKMLQVSSEGSSGHKMLKLVYFRSRGQVTLSQQIAPKISASREGNSAKSASANCTVFGH